MTKSGSVLLHQLFGQRWCELFELSDDQHIGHFNNWYIFVGIDRLHELSLLIPARCWMAPEMSQTT
jgi:hypothetical protein